MQNEYKCTRCGEKFRVTRTSFFGCDYQEKLVCPNCHSTEVEPVSTTVFHPGYDLGASRSDSSDTGRSR
ncbi:MAG: zinc ribbon domain-containing protein [Dehalococcoidia bacterium]|nr:zinc ribbon domain-containing protein [Dehalococcoidia bacterium]